MPITEFNRSAECATKARDNLKVLGKEFSNTVVFAAMTWHHKELWFGDNDKYITISPEDYIKGLESLSEALAKQGNRLVVIGPILRPEIQLASILSRGIKFGKIEEHDAEAMLSSLPGSKGFFWMMKVISELENDLEILSAPRALQF